MSAKRPLSTEDQSSTKRAKDAADEVSQNTEFKMTSPPTTQIGRMSKEPRLKDKICFISGASQGFGQAIAIRFVEEGAKVVIFSRSGCDGTLDLIGQISGFDGNVEDVALSCKCDISNEKQIDAMIQATTKKWGPKAHVLVNNAALFIFKSVEFGSAEDWDRACNVNIKGHALVTKAVLPMMKKAGGGSLIFQGSISSFLAQPNCATYSVMKGAIVQMMRNCAFDFAKYGIRSNSICAGTIETPISETERKEHGWSFEKWEALKTKDVMLRRVGHVREIANATLFFASDESSYCTGTTLMVDGGQTANTHNGD